MIRKLLFGLTAFAAVMAAGPTTAADLDKYVSKDAKAYLHVNVPKLFTSEMVRKTLPMAFDKYSEAIIEGLGMVKQFAPPGTPELPEDQAKAMLKKVTDPKVIAEAFDVAKDVVTEIVVSGSVVDGEPNFVIVVKCEKFNAEEFDTGMQAAGAIPGLPTKFETIKKAKGNVYVMEVPQTGQKIFMAIPEKGVLHICMSEEKAEGAFAAASKPSAKLAELMAKRNKNDFVFFAGLGEDDDDYASMSGSVILDKDLSVKATRTFKDEAKAKAEAQMMNDNFAKMSDLIKGFIGEIAAPLKPHLDKSKATADGKTVNATISIPGSAVEKMLGKD